MIVELIEDYIGMIKDYSLYCKNGEKKKVCYHFLERTIAIQKILSLNSFISLNFNILSLKIFYKEQSLRS